MAKAVSKELGVELHVVLYVYMSFFDAIVDKIESTDFESLEEDSPDKRMSFNIQYIGKLYTTDNIVNNINRHRLNRRNESIKH
jgi:hypothetical protein